MIKRILIRSPTRFIWMYFELQLAIDLSYDAKGFKRPQSAHLRPPSLADHRLPLCRRHHDSITEDARVGRRLDIAAQGSSTTCGVPTTQLLIDERMQVQRICLGIRIKKTNKTYLTHYSCWVDNWNALWYISYTKVDNSESLMINDSINWS